MRECFQESFLRGFFGLTSVAKETVRNVEHARAEAANDFGKGGLVGIAREAGQFNFGRLFVVVRQQCSSIEVDGPLGIDPSFRLGDLFVVTRSTHATASAATFLGLRFQLIELRLLLSRQNGQHFLMELKSRAHHLGLQGR